MTLRPLRFVALCACAAFCLVAVWGNAAEPDQGIWGRASEAGVLTEGVLVRAYPYRPGTFGPWTGESAAGEARTAGDGSYRIRLPPGRYVVEGLKKAGGRVGPRPETGDAYVLHAGSPVAVQNGAWTPVGLTLVPVPEEGRSPADAAHIAGTVTWEGATAQRVYLYLYSDPSTGFHGPARVAQPLATGEFRLRVAPGTYYLVARQRSRGGPYGPVEVGDRSGFYPRNPVTVTEGEGVTLEIPLVERTGQLEAEVGALPGLTVRVVDDSGKPVRGVFVLAYPSEARAGVPVATSPATDGEGRTRINAPPGGEVFLRARRTLGGPLEEGELFGDARATPGSEGETIVRLGPAR